MTSEPASGSGWQPTWRRVVGTTVVLFLAVLAFLVGRVRARADPGLARETTRATPQQSAPSRNDPRSSGSDPFAQPPAGQGADPGTGGGDNFGNALPDQGSGDSVEPPSTHVS
jgi:hypothetical protein